MRSADSQMPSSILAVSDGCGASVRIAVVFLLMSAHGQFLSARVQCPRAGGWSEGFADDAVLQQGLGQDGESEIGEIPCNIVHEMFSLLDGFVSVLAGDDDLPLAVLIGDEVSILSLSLDDAVRPADEHILCIAGLRGITNPLALTVMVENHPPGVRAVAYGNALFRTSQDGERIESTLKPVVNFADFKLIHNVPLFLQGLALATRYPVDTPSVKVSQMS